MFYFLVRHKKYGNILLFRGKKPKRSCMKFDRAVHLKTPYIPDCETRLNEVESTYEILGRSADREYLIGLATLEVL
jgi:hypothetical protein